MSVTEVLNLHGSIVELLPDSYPQKVTLNNLSLSQR